MSLPTPQSALSLKTMGEPHWPIRGSPLRARDILGDYRTWLPSFLFAGWSLKALRAAELFYTKLKKKRPQEVGPEAAWIDETPISFFIRARHCGGLAEHVLVWASQ